MSPHSQSTLPLFKAKHPTATHRSLSKNWHSNFKYLTIYFAFNLGLTVYNKALMGTFPFPVLLTALHAAAGTAGCWILARSKYFTPSLLTLQENLWLTAFSLLYTINITISNASLHLVSIPFHQVVRATTPVFTVIICRFILGRHYKIATYLSLIPVVVGVGLACHGDFDFTWLGFSITLTGALLAALKTVATNWIQSGRLRLPVLEILYRMSPLALLQSLVYAQLNGEIESFGQLYVLKGRLTSSAFAVLLVNGALAFGLNVVSFISNKKTGALSMTVAANVKQILSIVVGTLFFHVHVGGTNMLGIVLTLAGGGWYAAVEFNSNITPAARHSPK